MRRLNLTTGVSHGGAGAESGGGSKGDGGRDSAALFSPFWVIVWKEQPVVHAGTKDALKSAKRTFLCVSCDLET